MIVLARISLIINPDPTITANQVEYGIHINETNLVARISIALNAYRRQRDRMADLMNQMQRIVSGE